MTKRASSFFRLTAEAWLLVLLAMHLPGAPTNARAQDRSQPAVEADAAASSPKVEVRPSAGDDDIARRLERILEATGWFEAPQVRVDEGVAFLGGRAQSEQNKKWAGELARNTRDVVAVVNRIEISNPPVWNFGPAMTALEELLRDALQIVPVVAFSVIILLFFGLLALVGDRVARPWLRRRVPAPLLRQVISRTIGLLLLLFGLYLVLRISGLSRLALSLIGGTGLIGLVIGIAFRDITENFLASVLLSVQRPFRPGDLVEISEILGYIQQLNVRTTVLMTLDGNHVQIPNATVYKSTIRNYTSNPNRRENFVVGIGYDARIDRAQEVALRVLAGHPAVLKEPEPWVLVDNLGPATVNLRIYFWLNGATHSWLKVRSSVIRLIKRSFQQEGISMPDAAREMVFPEGVPVRMVSESDAGTFPVAEPGRSISQNEGVATEAEARLDTESKQIERQAERARRSDEGVDLLRPQS